jgi:hypothetical protein
MCLRTKGLKCIGYVHSTTLFHAHRGTVYMPNTGLDSTAIYNDGRSIVTGGCHEASRHILITARNRDVAVIMLGLNGPQQLSSLLD